MRCMCQIIPNDVLRRLASDETLGDDIRQALLQSAVVDDLLRNIREEARQFSLLAQELGPLLGAIAPAPAVTTYDCRNGKTLPGVPVANPGHAADISAQRAFVEAGAVADFYKKVFNRNSIDNAGMTIMSSVHFGTKYNNAQWTGTQMLYGDGDGQ